VRIALIKTSSMGDVIHALPVVTDIVAARPDARIDWVVEEGFADLPRLHPAVREVIPVAIRRWRRTLATRATWSEIRATRARLREVRYDLALDLQGLVKSAWIARWTGAPVAGFDRASAREPLAALAYAKRYPVARDLHAIERLRSLAGQALGYRAEGGPRFGLSAPALALPWLPAGRFVVLLHATSRPEKQWPAQQWVALGARLRASGVSVVLAWGSDAERRAARQLADAIDGAREPALDAMDAEGAAGNRRTDGAERIVAGGTAGPRAIVAPRMSLRECARLLADACGVVGVDTGLTHLSAALDRPTVALFAATPAWRFGPYWTSRARSLGADGVWPQAGEVFDTLGALGALGAPAPTAG
jgi:heptosyltransferase-1